MKKKIYVILFCIALVFALCLVAGAKYVEWSVSEDGKTITSSNGDVYNYIYLNPNDKFKPSDKYSYENQVIINDYYYSIHTDKSNTNVIALSSIKTRYYVKDESRGALEAFRDGTYSSYGIAEGSSRLSKITNDELLARLDDGSKSSYDVRELYNYERYSILGFDSTGAFSHEIGAIYIGDDYGSDGKRVMLYVDYQSLPNNYFSSDGDFSYREGTVAAYEVSNQARQEVQELIDNAEYWSQSYTSEGDFNFDKENISLGASVAMLVFGIVALLAIPAVPVAIVSIRLIKKKAEHPRRAIALIASGAFLLLVTILLVIFIFL